MPTCLEWNTLTCDGSSRCGCLRACLHVCDVCLDPEVRFLLTLLIILHNRCKGWQRTARKPAHQQLILVTNRVLLWPSALIVCQSRLSFLPSSTSIVCRLSFATYRLPPSAMKWKRPSYKRFKPVPHEVSNGPNSDDLECHVEVHVGSNGRISSHTIYRKVPVKSSLPEAMQKMFLMYLHHLQLVLIPFSIPTHQLHQMRCNL